MPKKKRKAKMRIVQGVLAGPAPGKPDTVYDPEDPDPFRVPEHVKQTYNNLAVSAIRKRLTKRAAVQGERKKDTKSDHAINLKMDSYPTTQDGRVSFTASDREMMVAAKLKIDGGKIIIESWSSEEDAELVKFAKSNVHVEVRKARMVPSEG